MSWGKIEGIMKSGETRVEKGDWRERSRESRVKGVELEKKEWR